MNVDDGAAAALKYQYRVRVNGVNLFRELFISGIAKWIEYNNCERRKRYIYGTYTYMH